MKKIFLAIFIISIFSNIHSFGQKQFLTVGKTLYSHISPTKSDTFSVKMRNNQFASITITEKEVRIHALVYDPQDCLILIVDENQIGDKEVGSFFSKKPGNYKIVVNWNFSKPYTGKYSITLDKLEEEGKTAIQKAEQLLDGWYAKNAPGVAMAVVKNGKVIFKKNKGLANVEETIPISSNSIFEIASCSKQFTGLAIAMLIDQGKLSLKDDIRKYIPEMPNYGNEITIEHLVTHTSGIRSTDLIELTGFTPEDPINLQTCVRFAINQKSLRFEPGKRFEYSNTNYNLLAEIVLRVTGMPFEIWTKINIFNPLGMNSTFFKADPGQVYANKVNSYEGIKAGYRQRPNNWTAMGGSALNSSLDDLIKWVNSFETKQLISPGIDSLLGESKTTTNRYSFGNEYKIYINGTREINHLGLVIGYRSAIVRYPDLKLSIIYLTNDNNDATYNRFNKIKDLFVTGNLIESKPSLTGFPNAKEVVKNIEQEEAYKETNNLNDYRGSYASSELECVWHISIKNNRLIVSNQKIKEIKLKNTGSDKFGFIEFLRDDNQKVNGLRLLNENIKFDKFN
jgi:CubicO group peptidase (beta-lactamase class C family)